jgi:hypothetical protein
LTTDQPHVIQRFTIFGSLTVVSWRQFSGIFAALPQGIRDFTLTGWVKGSDFPLENKAGLLFAFGWETKTTVQASADAKTVNPPSCPLIEPMLFAEPKHDPRHCAGAKTWRS